MLTPEIQAEILFRHLRSGHSARRIAKDLGINRRSVARVIERRSVKVEKALAKRPSMLDVHVPLLTELLANEDALSASVIMQRLRAAGYLGGYTILREWIAAHRPPSGSPKKEAFLTLTFAPGECAQVDWGEFGDVFGDGSKVHCFVMVLCHSRLMYIEFTRSEKFEDFIRCHERALAFFGGLPEEIWYDNLASAVSERIGKIVRFNARFFAYVGHHGFRPHACNKGQGNEKGRVEDGVKYVRYNFWPGRRFKDFHDIQEQARIWQAETANRREHAATRRIPELVFAAEEKAELKPLRPDRYDTDEVFAKEVPPNFRLTYQTNRYSVPWTLVGQVVTVRVCETSVRVFYNERQVARHERSYGRDADISKKAHEEGLLEIKSAAKDSRSWQAEALSSMGPSLKRYLDYLGVSPRSLRYEISKLLALTTVYGADAVDRIVASFLARGIIGADQIELALKNSSQAATKPAPLTFQKEQLQRVPPRVDLRRYDALLFTKADTTSAGTKEACDEATTEGSPDER